MWLTIRSGPDTGHSIECQSGTLTIGRDPDCDLRLSDNTVSRRHAMLALDGPDSGRLQDEGSQNGTFVNDVRLLGPVALRGVEQLRIGDTIIQLAPSNLTATATSTPAIPTNDGAWSPTTDPLFADSAQIGIASQHDVSLTGGNVAGRDLRIYNYNQQLVRWQRMRRNARRLLIFSIFLFLAGLGLFGSWIVRWDTSIFSAVNGNSDQNPNTPSPLPWLPLGMFVMFVGIVLFITALVIRRTKEPASPT